MPALEPHGSREGSRKKGQGSEPDLGNPAVRDYRGASGNVARVEMRSHLAIERASLVTLHLQLSRRSSIPTNSRPASSAVPRQPCQNNGTRRSLPDPDREHRCGRAHAISYLTRVCTRAVQISSELSSRILSSSSSGTRGRPSSKRLYGFLAVYLRMSGRALEGP